MPDVKMEPSESTSATTEHAQETESHSAVTTPRRPMLMASKRDHQTPVTPHSAVTPSVPDEIQEPTESRKRAAETYIPASEQPRNKRIAAAMNGSLAPRTKIDFDIAEFLFLHACIPDACSNVPPAFSQNMVGQEITVKVDKVTALGFYISSHFLDRTFKGILFIREEPRPAKFIRDEPILPLPGMTALFICNRVADGGSGPFTTHKQAATVAAASAPAKPRKTSQPKKQAPASASAAAATAATSAGKHEERKAPRKASSSSQPPKPILQPSLFKHAVDIDDDIKNSLAPQPFVMLIQQYPPPAVLDSDSATISENNMEQ